MEIVHETPGRDFVLEETTPRMPLAILAGGLALLCLVAAPWRGLWAILVRGAGTESLDLVGPGVWLVVGALCLLSLRGGSRLERLAIDHMAGRLDWTTSHVGGLWKWRGGFALESLQGFALATVPKGSAGVSRPAARSSGGSPLRLTLRRQSGARGSEHSLDLRVKNVDESAEVAALAMRIGSASGLSFHRVILDAAPHFEIEVRKEGGPVRGALSVPTASAHEPVPPFDPARFRGSARVAVWEPGRLVVFARSWSLSVLLAPLVMAAFLGPLAYLRLSSLRQMPLLPQVAALALITLAGLGVALIGLAGALTGLPRRVTLDWGARTLSLESLRERRRIPFADLVAIEMRSRTYKGRSGRQQYTTSYRTEIRAVLRSAEAEASTGELLVETRLLRDDPVLARATALPLAVELAAALGVARLDT
jgi:hypothetical protein